MKSVSLKYIGIWIIIGISVVGCTGSGKPSGRPGQEVYYVNQEHLEASAKKLLEILTNLEYIWTIGRQHSKKYAEAHNAFLTARQNLPFIRIPKASSKMQYINRFVKFDTNTHRLVPTKSFTLEGDNYQEAGRYMQESLEHTQHLLRQYYLKEVIWDAGKVYENLKQTAREDPDGAFRELLVLLEKDLAYSDRIQTNPFLMDIPHIKQTKRIISDVEFNLNCKKALHQTLITDALFTIGKYALEDLSLQGKSRLQMFTAHLITITREFAKRSPDQVVVLTIKTIGYTDQSEVFEGTDVIAALSEGVEDLIPHQNRKRRKFLNQRFSEFRAKTVNEYVQQQFAILDKQQTKVQFNSEIVGKGEEISPEFSPPFPPIDSRRRICKISCILYRQ